MTDRSIVSEGDLDARIAVIEEAFLVHWRHFGRWPGSSLHREHGVEWFETPIAHLPYNAVMRAVLPWGVDPDATIADVIGRFRARGVPFMWVTWPHDEPADMGHRLAAHGLDLVEEAVGMDLSLDRLSTEPMPSGVEIRSEETPALLADYEGLIRTYWSVPESDRHQIELMNRYWSSQRNPGERFVAYLDGQPVGKLFLNLGMLPDTVGVYGVATLPEARGRGVATALLHASLDRSGRLGADRAVLHSSPMAVSLYRRIGFQARCSIPVYATAALFGTHHH